MVLNLGIGLHAPELEVVVAAQTAVASLPICVKEVWFEVSHMGPCDSMAGYWRGERAGGKPDSL